jgi:ribonuclease HI
MSCKIVGYCDGACKGNPGKGGWGCFYETNDFPGKWCFYGGAISTTNNEMELTAMKVLLENIYKHLAGEKRVVEVTIFSDSSYVLKGIVKNGEGNLAGLYPNGWIEGWTKNGWKTSSGTQVKNEALWKDIAYLVGMNLAEGRSLRFEWVKGHSGNEGNEFADELSNEWIRKN